MEEGLLQSVKRQGRGGGSSSSSSTPTFAVVFSTFIAVCGSAAYGCAMGYSSPAQFGIMHELELSTAEYSLFGSLLTFGTMLGAIVSGKVADLIGRKGATLFLEFFFIAGWLAIAFAKDVYWIDIGRLSLGFSSGLQFFVSTVYIAEITPKDFRGGFALATQLMICCGVVLMFFIGNIVSWRSLALIGIVPCLVQVIGVPFIPESPRWLAKVGQVKKLEASLQYLRGKDANVFEEAAQIMDSTRPTKEQSNLGFRQLFERRYARSLVVGLGISFLLPWGGYSGIVTYANSIFDASGSTFSMATTTVALIQIPFSVSGVFLMDKLGRRTLLMTNVGGLCVGGALAGLAFILKNTKLSNVTPTLVLVSFLIFFSFFAIGAGLPAVLISEIFPINIKGTAGSLALFANCFSSWVVAYAFDFLFTWSSSGVFLIFAIISGLLLLFVAKMLPETKGLSLEEIQTLWT